MTLESEMDAIAAQLRAPVPLSVLDLAIVRTSSSSTEALAETTATAQRADELGYQRFWVAEHHNMATVASTSPPVLMAHLAARTNRIRLGSGGVMLPNHAPYAVAEQFALLEALYPNRIDLGIGRAPGTDGYTASALRRGVRETAEDTFPRDVLDVLGLLGDQRRETGLHERLSATPHATTFPMVALLGSSGYSAQLAGMLGLPFGFAHHFDMGGTHQAADIYREHFEPSAALAEPHLIVTAVVMAAETREQAEYLLAPHRLRKFSMRRGQRPELVDPETAMAHPLWSAAAEAPFNAIFGTGEEAAEALQKLAAETQASELMVSAPATHLDARLDTLARVAAAWG